MGQHLGRKKAVGQVRNLPHKFCPAALSGLPEAWPYRIHSFFLSGGSIMSVARSDEGAGNVTKRRAARKPSEAVAPGAPAAATGPAVRLDDLYRLPMPKLFAFA